MTCLQYCCYAFQCRALTARILEEVCATWQMPRISFLALTYGIWLLIYLSNCCSLICRTHVCKFVYMICSLDILYVFQCKSVPIFVYQSSSLLLGMILAQRSAIRESGTTRYVAEDSVRFPLKRLTFCTSEQASSSWYVTGNSFPNLKRTRRKAKRNFCRYQLKAKLLECALNQTQRTNTWKYVQSSSHWHRNLQVHGMSNTEPKVRRQVSQRPNRQCFL